MDTRLTMPGSDGAAGFSLVEVMIVVAVLSVLSVAAGLSVGRTGPVRENDAEAFATAYEAGQLAAILARHPRALALTDTGWTPLEPDPDAPGGWRTAGPERALVGAWREGATGAPLRSAVVGAETQADVVFLPDGQTTPVDLRFIARAGERRCAADGWGTLACRAE